MNEIGETLHLLVWGPWTLALFLGTGLWFTVRSGFFQLRGAGTWWRETAGSLFRREEQEEKGITCFQSACTALAATVGTGNIVGVAAAVRIGGAGALFWMWISAAVGMMTAYAETSLGQRFRYRTSGGSWMCGPMVYMERGLGCPAMGILYAFLAVMTSLGMGSMVQANSISETLRFGAGLPAWLTALVLLPLSAFVLLGGISRISRAAERLMPVSAGIYILFSLAVLLACRERLPQVFAAIVKDAFRGRAAGGGIGGILLSRGVRYGLSRGVFSNEAGLGSLAILHGAAEEGTPQQQGMWAMFEVFLDTMVICTLTGLVILCGGLSETGRLDGAALAARSFSLWLGAAGEFLIAGSMTVFAFATILAWYYLGRQALEYLLRERKGAEMCRRFYTLLYLLAVLCGCFCRLEAVWLFSDLWNGLMAYPNLLALLLLSGKVRFPGTGRRKTA